MKELALNHTDFFYFCLYFYLRTKICFHSDDVTHISQYKVAPGDKVMGFLFLGIGKTHLNKHC